MVDVLSSIMSGFSEVSEKTVAFLGAFFVKLSIGFPGAEAVGEELIR